jgi:hypothetical protein
VPAGKPRRPCRDLTGRRAARDAELHPAAVEVGRSNKPRKLCR